MPEGTYADWTQLRNKVLAVAKKELDQLAPFRFEFWDHNQGGFKARQGRKVVKVRLWFYDKEAADAALAAAERERPKTGRKARREGTTEELIDDKILY